tara:strand:- start:6947 stop:8116 length:1170 start_codon:yes stop_codon:yes gene_type:complete
MILTKNIVFKNFSKIKKDKVLKKKLDIIIKKNNEILKSLGTDYNYSYSKKIISRLKKKFSSIRLIGMGGSILGTKAIYKFLNNKIKKEIIFIDNLIPKRKYQTKNKKILNIVVSKSGNTLETILNTNIFVNKKSDNVFITENKNSYLRKLADQLKSEIVDHNNFIGGRYSVLSEVGMLPSSLVGLNEKKFKQFNNLIKNQTFINNLIINSSNMIYFINQKKFNSIIINYDESSDDFFKWYQQLVAESLGKKQKGIFPLISTMPKDNHSMMQLYLDGPKKSFFTFFDVIEKKSDKIKNKLILSEHNFLKNKKLFEVLSSQKKGSENVFFKNSVPFRSFEILNRNEETMGELFTFFILETILIAKAIKVNPYDQPSVELIKKNTKRILKNI